MIARPQYPSKQSGISNTEEVLTEAVNGEYYKYRLAEPRPMSRRRQFWAAKLLNHVVRFLQTYSMILVNYIENDEIKVVLEEYS